MGMGERRYAIFQNGDIADKIQLQLPEAYA